MKIRMLETPKGRGEYQKGEVYDFKGKVEEGYALKFIDRGWAEPHDAAALKMAERAAQEARDAEAAERVRAEAEAKARAEAEAKAKAEAEKAKQQGGGQQA